MCKPLIKHAVETSVKFIRFTGLRYNRFPGEFCHLLVIFKSTIYPKL